MGRSNGGILGVVNAPTASVAPGVWSLHEQSLGQIGENWPIMAPSWSVDISNLSYDSKSFSVGSQESSPRSLAFNPDGTKMYILGFGSDSVYQYSLSTAFDVSTASYDSVSFSVSSQETAPQGLDFNNDGTKMYVIGSTTDTVYQYSLSTAFDVSTASYDSKSFSASSQETSCSEIVFNADGTKMYVAGTNSDRVHQYSLSTAFDVSTASYDSKSLDTSSQDTVPRGVAFNPLGTQLFVAGDGTNTLYQYSLSTAFDVSTAVYDSKSFSVSAQDAGPTGLNFSTYGAKLFFIGGSGQQVYQYSTGL